MIRTTHDVAVASGYPQIAASLEEQLKQPVTSDSGVRTTVPVRAPTAVRAP